MHPQMKNIAASLLLMLIFSTAAFAQTVYSLEQLRAAAKENYPEFKQKALSKQGYDLEIEKLKTLLYPKLNFGLQASWQSAVTAIEIPGGTAFASLPDDWCCPGCDAPKHKFMVLGE